ncbi:mitochondrial import inner membrane translocase subunit Tim13-like [Durio zibethinus]|uniref:Mitochondrial import inner membrane translocase subunit n=1 Tax=Durio zibethinus TaxID=66656 RepID=A0A6P6B9E3_DURZI|nr:mitochondrial import inner membrane translocase subunit Tim13-like [Durio zibethinus]
MGSFSTGSSETQISTKEFMEQMNFQLAQAYVEKFLQTVRDKCFDKCITKPGSSVSGTESSCISRCMDRYFEATRIVSRAFNASR